ncbi:sensor histidine kinase [Dyadobacter arcticus]|uniref:Sensor histidine kinase YesM n=1 Tax=Dyadobacter arcticus TaxID=1078754 RepID=A0ABX0UV98_9BACT|nr:sensor histidine kinase [Dyadobacter arcticus]NIJ55740.1 sensor histidine kinase YesM [Dyadobacter arcticus]
MSIATPVETNISDTLYPRSTKGSRKFWNFSPGFIGVNFLIGIAITLSSCPSCFLSLSGIRDIWDNILESFVMSCVLSYGGFMFEDYFDRTISWIQFPVKRLVLECLCYFLYVFVASFIIIFIILYFFRESFTLRNIPWKDMVNWTKFPMQISFVITFILISRSFLLEWRKAAIEAEQLKTERFAQQFQSLKDQLNPHFLFNSLNVLSNLVYENADTSARFINKLSKIYRYVLDVQQEELVSLEKELDFAENYLSLQKIRFEESLQYHIDVGQKTGFLPPLSLQLLLENAIKHNIASVEKPLKIEIAMADQVLTVKNNLQLKSSISEDSTGIGLSNISKRYELLSKERISILNDGDSFIVKLPLLSV